MCFARPWSFVHGPKSVPGPWLCLVLGTRSYSPGGAVTRTHRDRGSKDEARPRTKDGPGTKAEGQGTSTFAVLRDKACAGRGCGATRPVVSHSWSCAI